MAEPLKYVVPPEMDPEPSDSTVAAPKEEDPAYGWNPGRGSEAHGVPIAGGYPAAPTEDDVRETFKDYEPPPDVDIREQEPVPVVEVYSEKITRRIVASTTQLPLPNGVWVKVLEDNPRRTSVRWWTDPAPQGSNPLNLSTDPDNRIVGLVPFMLGGGINNQVNVNYFTNELWLMSSGIDRTFHCIEEFYRKA